MKGFTINDLSIGQEASFTKTISETDVYLFAGITGDINPAAQHEIILHTTDRKSTRLNSSHPSSSRMPSSA